MQISVAQLGPGLRSGIGLLLDRMLSPLCGLDQRISLALLADTSPRVISIGAELTGIHVLQGLPPPPIGSYHIGGVGLSLDDAVIRTLGETAERYAQLSAEIYRANDIRFATSDELSAAGHRVIPDAQLALFEPSQHARPGFPFVPFRPDMPIGWVEGSSLVGRHACWIPAQAVFVGYQARDHLGEGRIYSGVTTGTAAHRTHDCALLNAILELVQIDCAMGHWYTSWPAYPLVLDQRVEIFTDILQTLAIGAAQPEFFWIPSPDLPGFVIACMYRSRGGRIPAASVGLGCSLKLDEALYKGWLEAVGVTKLASVTLLQANQDIGPEPEIYDLDSNVAWYAAGHGAALLQERFAGEKAVATTALPDDVKLEPIAAVEHLIAAFRLTGKDLYRWDLTPCDIADLGLAIERVWSPDTISLSMPSAPPARHGRFLAFGGITHGQPHPYP